MKRIARFLRQVTIRFVQWLDKREYDKYARQRGYKDWKDYAKKENNNR